MARASRRKRYFGNVRKLPSGRFQARYTGPDGQTHSARTPEGKPLTFDTEGDADAWLSLRRAEILSHAWRPPAQAAQDVAGKPTLREFADKWLVERELGQNTREHYGQLLTDHIYPRFDDVEVPAIKPADVREWYSTLARAEPAKDGQKAKRDRPTTRAHAYTLLRTILNTAMEEDPPLIEANPCRIRGAGQAKRARKVKPATLAELEVIVASVPSRYRLMVMMAAWCAMRFGELAELRRRDIEKSLDQVGITRGVARTKRGRVVKGPKSEAGVREVSIPPHLVPMVRDHLRDHVGMGKDALLFPAARDPKQHMSFTTLYRVFYPARKAAGRPDLRFHDLRHTGAVLAAQTGATIKELMSRLGHSTPGAAMIYQHAAQDRDKVIARGLSDLAAGTAAPEEPVDDLTD